VGAGGGGRGGEEGGGAGGGPTSSSNTSICHYTKGDSHQVQKRGRKGGGCLS